MDRALRQLFEPDPGNLVERLRRDRLCQGDADALMELYDELAPLAYGWALQLTRSRRRAIRTVRDAFLRAVHEPQVFCDSRVSSGGWILLEVHHLAWIAAHPVPDRPPEVLAGPALIADAPGTAAP